MRYVALLRGINLGKKRVKMESLKELFEGLGFKDVKSVLASGNLLFVAEGKEIGQLKEEIEKGIKERFGFSVTVQIREFDQLLDLVKSNPFSNYVPNPDSHWYVTFLNHELEKIPDSVDGQYQFIGASHKALFSVLNRNGSITTDFMTMLDKALGKEVTTRNWNTLLKIVKA